VLLFRKLDTQSLVEFYYFESVWSDKQDLRNAASVYLYVFLSELFYDKLDDFIDTVGIRMSTEVFGIKEL
jgi:hypothetical protein